MHVTIIFAMNKARVACIPNFSEGRRLTVIDAITDSIAKIPKATILDRHIDAHHNRTVITYVGSPASVLQAAFQAVSTASTLIDMEQHNGEHPRIGATDVVPFVPLNGTAMKTCVQMAVELGSKVGDELGIPVYLYEHAAIKSARRNLANVRRGEYEKLRNSISIDPKRYPDFGPKKLGSPGATAIGARTPLIAFNVNLTTNDVLIAQNIAKTIRQSSGGLECVKSIGIMVDGLAQVSTNITDHTKTPVIEVVDAIRSEAANYGVDIDHSEIVGLIPQDALEKIERWHLPENLELSNYILEQRLSASLQS